MKEVVIIRGVAGSGKSTFANLLAQGHGGKIVEADKFAYNDQGVYDWKFEELSSYHRKAMAEFDSHIENSESMIIVSNVSARWQDFKYYFNKAKESGYKVTTLVVENRNETNSIHGVPEDTLNNMREKFQIKL